MRLHADSVLRPCGSDELFSCSSRPRWVAGSFACRDLTRLDLALCGGYSSVIGDAKHSANAPLVRVECGSPVQASCIARRDWWRHSLAFAGCVLLPWRKSTVEAVSDHLSGPTRR